MHIESNKGAGLRPVLTDCKPTKLPDTAMVRENHLTKQNADLLGLHFFLQFNRLIQYPMNDLFCP